jgi:hypothetical protein
MLKFRKGIQFFAEGDPAGDPATDPAAPAKVFSADYVKALRDESKDHRLARKAAEDKAAATEAKFKKLIGIKDTEELDDSKIAAWQAAQSTAITAAEQKANAKLILAEIKSLDGYDSKLVTALLDKSKVKIADDGTITGLKEAVEALAVEFPAIKKAPGTPPVAGGVNPPPAGNLTEIQQLQTDYDVALKAGKTAEAISLKNKIFEKNKK